MNLDLADVNAKVQFLKLNGWYEYNGKWFKNTEGVNLDLAYTLEKTEQKEKQDDHRNYH